MPVRSPKKYQSVKPIKPTPPMMTEISIVSIRLESPCQSTFGAANERSRKLLATTEPLESESPRSPKSATNKKAPLEVERSLFIYFSPYD
jgi:hypothetical protein